jgi:hypothetical protein
MQEPISHSKFIGSVGEEKKERQKGDESQVQLHESSYKINKETKRLSGPAILQH